MTVDKVSMHAIRREMERRDPEYAANWLDPKARRFFGERLPRYGYRCPQQVRYGFVTHNEGPGCSGYTVRILERDGSIETMGGPNGLCAYPESIDATRALKRALGGGQ